MSKTVVQINFEVHMPMTEYEAMAEQAAQPIAEVEGLEWKIFLINEAAQEAAGLYLCENAITVEAYLRSPIITALSRHPGIRNPSIKLFDIQEGFTEVTRGPVKVPVTVK
jgi:hypothetical protein